MTARAMPTYKESECEAGAVEAIAVAVDEVEGQDEVTTTMTLVDGATVLDVTIDDVDDAVDDEMVDEGRAKLDIEDEVV